MMPKETIDNLVKRLEASSNFTRDEGIAKLNEVLTNPNKTYKQLRGFFGAELTEEKFDSHLQELVADKWNVLHRSYINIIKFGLAETLDDVGIKMSDADFKSAVDVIGLVYVDAMVDNLGKDSIESMVDNPIVKNRYKEIFGDKLYEKGMENIVSLLKEDGINLILVGAHCGPYSDAAKQFREHIKPEEEKDFVMRGIKSMVKVQSDAWEWKPKEMKEYIENLRKQNMPLIDLGKYRNQYMEEQHKRLTEELYEKVYEIITKKDIGAFMELIKKYPEKTFSGLNELIIEEGIKALDVYSRGIKSIEDTLGVKLCKEFSFKDIDITKNKKARKFVRNEGLKYYNRSVDLWYNNKYLYVIFGNENGFSIRYRKKEHLPAVKELIINNLHRLDDIYSLKTEKEERKGKIKEGLVIAATCITPMAISFLPPPALGWGCLLYVGGLSAYVGRFSYWRRFREDAHTLGYPNNYTYNHILKQIQPKK